MPHLTENEVVQFYAAYRVMEATASSLRNEVERLRQKTIKVEVERGLADGARLLQGSGAVCHRAQFSSLCPGYALSRIRFLPFLPRAAMTSTRGQRVNAPGKSKAVSCSTPLVLVRGRRLVHHSAMKALVAAWCSVKFAA